MSFIKQQLNCIKTGELFYQILLHIVLFFFFSFDRHSPVIGWVHVAFFFNYAMAALVINYWLIPLFYNKRQFMVFTFFISVLIAMVIGIEELVLEQVYFPGTDRAKFTPNVFYCLLDVLPIIVILVGFKFAWDIHDKQKRIDELNQLIKDSELQYLKNQINPHFLFNNLNNLYVFALENSPKTPTIILELSGVLRYMLYDCSEEFVSLSKEIKHVQNYIELHKIQFEQSSHVNFESKGSYENWEIAPLILTTFIENAFKHSASSMTEHIYIDIKSNITEDGKLTFTCENSFTKQSNVENLGKGIGLKNVIKRLNILYPQKHHLDINSNDNIFNVQLSIFLKVKQT